MEQQRRKETAEKGLVVARALEWLEDHENFTRVIWRGQDGKIVNVWVG